MYYHGKNKTPVREVVLHCAAIKTGQFSGLTPFEVFATVNRWHIERGFRSGFGYHGLVMPDGIFYRGRPFDMIGAHVRGENVGTLGFLLVESREVTRVGDFLDWFELPQRQTLLGLLASLKKLGIERVSGHNDYAAKLCPGFRVKTTDWL